MSPLPKSTQYFLEDLYLELGELARSLAGFRSCLLRALFLLMLLCLFSAFLRTCV